MKDKIKIFRGFAILLLALVLYGVLLANSLCGVGNNVCTNWTSNDTLVNLWILLILLLSITGIFFLIKDLYSNKELSWKKKVALSIAMVSIVGVPYSFVITPILIVIVVKFMK